MRISLILTGGTIGSESKLDGTLKSSGHGNLVLLTEFLFEKKAEYIDKVEFAVSSPIDILSENLMQNHWNKLITQINKELDSDSDAIIITHGTDTVAYSANLLSILFYGSSKPIFIVSSSKPLSNKNANGYSNFVEAVSMIYEGESQPGLVYVPYKNRDGIMTIHDGNRLIPCDDLSPDFKSAHRKLNEPEYISEKLEGKNLKTIKEINASILAITPYPGMDYRHFDLQGVDGVLHRTYHSSTVTTDIAPQPQNSIFWLKNKCDEHNIPMYFAPVLSQSKQVYETTAQMKKRGIIPLFDMTFEMAYAFLLVYLSS